MEIQISDTTGLPPDSIISVRAGPHRRQAPLETLTSRPLKFPTGVLGCNPFKVDVFVPVGSKRMILRPDVQKYSATIEGETPMTVGFTLKEDEVSSEKILKDRINIETPQFNDAVTAARNYLDKHNTLHFVQSLLQSVCREQPDDPYLFMAKQLYVPEDFQKMVQMEQMQKEGETKPFMPVNSARDKLKLREQETASLDGPEPGDKAPSPQQTQQADAKKADAPYDEVVEAEVTDSKNDTQPARDLSMLKATCGARFINLAKDGKLSGLLPSRSRPVSRGLKAKTVREEDPPNLFPGPQEAETISRPRTPAMPLEETPGRAFAEAELGNGASVVLQVDQQSVQPPQTTTQAAAPLENTAPQVAAPQAKTPEQVAAPQADTAPQVAAPQAKTAEQVAAPQAATPSAQQVAAPEVERRSPRIDALTDQLTELQARMQQMESLLTQVQPTGAKPADAAPSEVKSIEEATAVEPAGVTSSAPVTEAAAPEVKSVEEAVGPAGVTSAEPTAEAAAPEVKSVEEAQAAATEAGLVTGPAFDALHQKVEASSPAEAASVMPEQEKPLPEQAAQETPGEAPTEDASQELPVEAPTEPSTEQEQPTKAPTEENFFPSQEQPAKAPTEENFFPSQETAAAEVPAADNVQQEELAMPEPRRSDGHLYEEKGFPVLEETAQEAVVATADTPQAAAEIESPTINAKLKEIEELKKEMKQAADSGQHALELALAHKLERLQEELAGEISVVEQAVQKEDVASTQDAQQDSPAEFPKTDASAVQPPSELTGPIKDMAVENQKLIEDNRVLWQENQSKHKEVHTEMEALVAELNKHNSNLAEENKALKEQLEVVLAEMSARGEKLPANDAELAAQNEQLAEDNKQLWDQFQNYHVRVRSDMNELVQELDGYKNRLLEENSKLKAKLVAAGSRPGSADNGTQSA